MSTRPEATATADGMRSRPRSKRWLVVVIALGTLASGLSSLTGSVAALLRYGWWRVMPVEASPMLQAGVNLGRLSELLIFGGAGLLVGVGLLAASSWARTAALSYLAATIPLRILSIVGVLIYVEQAGVIQGATVNLVTALGPWTVGVVLRGLALLYLLFTDPARPAKRPPSRATASG